MNYNLTHKLYGKVSIIVIQINNFNQYLCVLNIFMLIRLSVSLATSIEINCANLAIFVELSC